MKRTLLFLTLLAITLTGCRNTVQENAPPISEQPLSKPVVYVSNYPLYFFASRIGEDKIDLRFPAESLKDPSEWTPPADTVAAMQKASLILLNGASFEGWLMNVSLPDTLLADTSEKFSDRLLPGGDVFTHSHGAEGEHEHQGTAFSTWLDLSLASMQAGAVKDALVRILPADQKQLESNFQALASQLTALDAAFRETASTGRDTYLVFSHPVYQYFQKGYGIKGKSLHWEAEDTVGHDMLHEIGHLKKDGDIAFMVWEGEPLPENVEKLNEEGIPSIVICPMGGAPASGDFLQGMEQNLNTLRKALARQPNQQPVQKERSKRAG